MKKNIGSVLALYPTPVTAEGAMMNGKPNWLLVADVGVMNHDHIMISCAKSHYTNQGIKTTGIVSVNIVDEEMLLKGDICRNKLFAYIYRQNSKNRQSLEHSSIQDDI